MFKKFIDGPGANAINSILDLLIALQNRIYEIGGECAEHWLDRSINVAEVMHCAYGHGLDLASQVSAGLFETAIALKMICGRLKGLMQYRH